jgi:hypothetical protein
MHVQAIFTQTSVEALDHPVLHRTARPDEVQAHAIHVAQASVGRYRNSAPLSLQMCSRSDLARKCPEPSPEGRAELPYLIPRRSLSGAMSKARAILTMFNRLTFRSPRSMPPT